jgi:transposase
MILTHKYRLKGKRSVRKLRRHRWACNQVWNYCVQIQRKIQRTYREGLSPHWPSQYDLQKLAGGTSRDLGLHAQTIQNICAQFVKSRDQHKLCPRYRKSNGPRRSLGWVPFQRQSRQLGPNFVTYLGHAYRFFGTKRRPLPEVVRGGCFVEDARGHWWICLQVEAANLPMAPGVAVGIDLGLRTLATLSTSKKIKGPRAFRKYEVKLATAQRAHNKQRIRALHSKIANVRRDHMHKWTARVARKYCSVFIGDVSSSRLAKTRMAKSVLDAGWTDARTTLRYKVSRHGGMFREIEERFTSQVCSACGILPASRPRGIADLGVREWRCSACGEIHDRDVNAARNILTLGLRADGILPINAVTGGQPPVEESRVAHGR